MTPYDQLLRAVAPATVNTMREKRSDPARQRGLTEQAVDSAIAVDGAITVHLDAGYDSDKTRAPLSERGLHGRIAHKGEKAPIQASQRWHVERTHARQNAFYRLACCYERRATVVNAFFDLADTIITVRSLIRQAWTTHRWGGRPNHRP